MDYSVFAVAGIIIWRASHFIMLNINTIKAGRRCSPGQAGLWTQQWERNRRRSVQMGNTYGDIWKGNVEKHESEHLKCRFDVEGHFGEHDLSRPPWQKKLCFQKKVWVRSTFTPFCGLSFHLSGSLCLNVVLEVLDCRISRSKEHYRKLLFCTASSPLSRQSTIIKEPEFSSSIIQQPESCRIL